MYLKGYALMGELMFGLANYFASYNSERPHQSLENKTPDVVYRSAIGGGTMIMDKFSRAVEGSLFRYAPQGIPPPQKQVEQPQQKQNRDSAAQLRLKSNVQLKLTALLS